jgi:hypothetical protein
MTWIDLTQDRERWWALVNTVMNLGIPWNAANPLTRWGTVSFSRRTLLHTGREGGREGGRKFWSVCQSSRNSFGLWAFQFTRNITIKVSTFHMFTLYINQITLYLKFCPYSVPRQQVILRATITCARWQHLPNVICHYEVTEIHLGCGVLQLWPSLLKHYL